jgi:L-arabinose isomerase
MHPLVNNLAGLKDAEIEAKINDLRNKYFMTANTGVKAQIAAMLESYKQELGQRRQAEWQKLMENRDKGLDKLINVS